jgi:hypothetical protein
MVKQQIEEKYEQLKNMKKEIGRYADFDSSSDSSDDENNNKNNKQK